MAVARNPAVYDPGRNRGRHQQAAGQEHPDHDKQVEAARIPADGVQQRIPEAMVHG